MLDNNFLIDKYHKDFKRKIGNYVPMLPENTDYYAVLVELREDHRMERALINHMYFLNNITSDIKWGLQIFHGNKNQNQIKSITEKWKNVKCVNLEIDDFDKLTYSTYIKTVDFWSKVKGEKVLMFQLDSLLLRYGIDDFLRYDYIGAPWTKPKEGSFVGNGGLSIRTKQTMIEIVEKHNTYPSEWEDIYFVKHLKDNNLPSIDVAMKFSVEDIFYPNPIGLHNPVKISPHLLSLILDDSLKNL